MSTLTVADAQRVPELAGVDSTLLQLSIDDIEEEIVSRFGDYGVGPITETIVLASSSAELVLKRRAATITSIKEYASVEASPSRELEPGDYLVRGFVIERLRSGANPRWSWSPYGIEVVYVPVDDTNRRKMATIDVLKLEHGFSGVGSLRIGDYSRSVGAAQGAADGVTSDRAKILRRLRPGPRMVLR